jgi:hypothetical protein
MRTMQKRGEQQRERKVREKTNGECGKRREKTKRNGREEQQNKQKNAPASVSDSGTRPVVSAIGFPISGSDFFFASP